MSVRACPNCGAEGANEGRARVCYQCGFKFDHTLLDATARAALARALAVSRPARRPSTVRAALARLGLALRAAGRHADAADAFAQALAERGSEPPSSELHSLRAAELIGAEKITEAVHEALWWACGDADGGARAIDVVRDALTPVSAEDLIGWLTSVWTPTLERADVNPRVHGLVLVAVAHALLGHGTSTTDALSAAYRSDPVRAAQAWASWLQAGGDHLRAVPGGEVYAVTLTARAAAALGDNETALALADRVIAEGLTAERYPELEAYWLRAELPGRTPQQRAADLVKVAQLYRWRDTPADLRRSVELGKAAVQAAPDESTAYWHVAEALRLLANMEPAESGTGLLEEALATWELGREREVPDYGWPWLVGALLHRDAARAWPEQGRGWAGRALSDAVECVFAEPSNATGWSLIAVECQRLKMWAAARLAVAQCVDWVRAWTADTAFEAFTVFQAMLDVDPKGLIDYLPKMTSSFADLSDEQLRFVEAAPRWSVNPLSAALTDEMVAVFHSLDTGVGPHAFAAVAYELIGRHDDALAAVEEMERVATANTSEALLSLSERAAALQWVGDERWLALRERLRDPQVGDIFARANLDLHDALKGGDLQAADEAYETLLAGSTPGGAALSAAEYTVLAERLEGAELAQAADRARTYAEGFAALAERARDDDAWSPAAVVAGLDRRACAMDLPEVAAAVSAVNALMSELGQESVIKAAAAAIAIPVAVVLSPDLVPADAGTAWEDWTLFRDLIPAVRERVRETVGTNCPGIRVRESDEGSARFDIVLDGRTTRSGQVSVPLPAERRTVGQWTDATAWRDVADTLVDVLRTRPTLFYAPALTRWMLEDASQDEQPDFDTPTWSAKEVVRTWRALRADFDAGIILPSGADLATRARRASVEPAASVRGAATREEVRAR